MHIKNKAYNLNINEIFYIKNINHYEIIYNKYKLILKFFKIF